MSYINVNDAPQPGASEQERTAYAAAIRAAINPGEVAKPEPLDEARIAAIKLPDGKPDLEAQQALREKHQRDEESYNAYQVNRSGRNALNNNPDGTPGSELKSLLGDAVAQLKKEGFIRG